MRAWHIKLNTHEQVFWKLTIPCITGDWQFGQTFWMSSLVTSKSYGNKYSLVELRETWTLVKATQKWYRLERVCWTFSWRRRSIEIWMSRLTTNNSAWRHTEVEFNGWNQRRLWSWETPGISRDVKRVNGQYWLCSSTIDIKRRIYPLNGSISSVRL